MRSEDKISTLHQQPKLAHNLSKQIVTIFVFIIYGYLQRDNRDIYVWVCQNSGHLHHWFAENVALKSLDTLKGFQNHSLVSEPTLRYFRICFFFAYCSISVYFEWESENNLLLSRLLPHFCLESRLVVTPPICYLPLDLPASCAAPNVNVSWDFPLFYKL